MTALAVTRERRLNCRVHFLRRAQERGLNISAFGVYRLERRIAMCAAAFVRDGIDRYVLTVLVAGDRAVVVYDTHLRCLVTVHRVQPFVIGPMRDLRQVRHA